MIFNTTETPPSEVAPKPPEVAPKPRKHWLIVTVLLVAVAIIAGVFAYWWLSRHSETSWLFEGAYATYAGNETVQPDPPWRNFTISLNLTMRLEVVEYNNTHAELLTYMKMESDLMQPIEWQNTTWTDLRNSSYKIEGYDVTDMYEDHVYIEGLGTKWCTVYEYASEDTTMTYYVDKETEWPIKMEFIVTEGSMTMDFDLTLKETNIPGLT